MVGTETYLGEYAKIMYLYITIIVSPLLFRNC